MIILMFNILPTVRNWSQIPQICISERHCKSLVLNFKFTSYRKYKLDAFNIFVLPLWTLYKQSMFSTLCKRTKSFFLFNASLKCQSIFLHKLSRTYALPYVFYRSYSPLINTRLSYMGLHIVFSIKVFDCMEDIFGLFKWNLARDLFLCK